MNFETQREVVKALFSLLFRFEPMGSDTWWDVYHGVYAS